MSNAIFETKIAIAETINPYQTRLQFILTDFQPNKNKQAIAESAADHLMQTALQMPVKIHFDGDSPNGHAQAFPIGPITRAWRGVDMDRDVVFAEAILWSKEHPAIDTYVKSAFAESNEIGTSWELRYADSETIDGVEWIKDPILTATTIVKNPAYGAKRTRVIAVAEENMDETENTEQKPSDEILSLQSAMAELVMYLNDVYYEVVAQERKEEIAVTAENALARLKEIMASWKQKRDSMAEDHTTALQTAQATIQTLEAAQTELQSNLCFASRRGDLARLFTDEEINARKATILEMSDTAFASYVTDLSARTAQAETNNKPKIPNLIGRTSKTIDELVAALNKTEK